jgi:NAD(P)-dependent dehydrogenase (short-subunit alcohol dehydrogenase family)
VAVVVITGSTRGIGLGLAKAFLERGHKVVVSSRGGAAVDQAVAELGGSASGKVAGFACDIVDPAQVAALWENAKAAFGNIDIWINNAGTSGPRRNVTELSQSEIASVVSTNLVGTINGMSTALRGMTAQGHGKVFNFEGFGSDGMSAPGLSVYGATKRAITYLTKSTNKEIKGSPVLLGTISPGIVVTDLLDDARDADPAQWERTKRLYNILGDRVETVAPYIAERVLATDKPGTAIRWLTQGKAIGRFLTARFTGRKVMPD